jgi:hypothetical protein
MLALVTIACYSRTPRIIFPVQASLPFYIKRFVMRIILVMEHDFLRNWIPCVGKFHVWRRDLFFESPSNNHFTIYFADSLSLE